MHMYAAFSSREHCIPYHIESNTPPPTLQPPCAVAPLLQFQFNSDSLAIRRVNFMKYQKPERKIDLNRSEVYKYLNPHLDRAPVRGIEVRAPLVAAESDIRQSLQS